MSVGLAVTAPHGELDLQEGKWERLCWVMGTATAWGEYRHCVVMCSDVSGDVLKQFPR